MRTITLTDAQFELMVYALGVATGFARIHDLRNLSTQLQELANVVVARPALCARCGKPVNDQEPHVCG